MKSQKNKAFTLIELLVVITIIGILATVGTVSLTNKTQQANDLKRFSNIRNVLNIIKRDSVVTRNGSEMYIYDSESIEKILADVNYAAETAGEDICYFIGIAKGQEELSGHDNEIAVAAWGNASSTLNQTKEGLLVVGTEQAVFNLSNTPINGDPIHSLLREDFLCEYPERMLKVQNAFAGRALNYNP